MRYSIKTGDVETVEKWMNEQGERASYLAAGFLNDWIAGSLAAPRLGMWVIMQTDSVTLTHITESDFLRAVEELQPDAYITTLQQWLETKCVSKVSLRALLAATDVCEKEGLVISQIEQGKGIARRCWTLTPKGVAVITQMQRAR